MYILNKNDEQRLKLITEANIEGLIIHDGDIILEVAQGKQTPVDVYNMRLDNAVRLIRGPKGTEVRLTVKKADGKVKIIPIIRDVVILEETYAKSLKIKENNDKNLSKHNEQEYAVLSFHRVACTL